MGSICRGASRAQDPKVAAAELAAALALPDAALTVFYCSPSYDLDALGAALRLAFGDTPLIGATTAGEIGPGGIAHGSITGASFPRSAGFAQVVVADALRRFELSEGERMAESLLAGLAGQGAKVTPLNTFAMLLIDGLAGKEEMVATSVHRSLRGVRMFGGSAADELEMQETFVYANGTFRSDRAVVAGWCTDAPFFVFRHQHVEPVGAPVIVTETDAPSRIVRELNGRPAAPEYAAAFGQTWDPGDPVQFASLPMVVTVGGENFLRVPLRILPDATIQFACAIDEGLIFRPGSSSGLLTCLRELDERIRAAVGTPELMLVADCVGRLVEAQGTGEVPEVGAVLDGLRAVGLCSYGEQIDSMHVNLTLTGVAIGAQAGSHA